jgi:hypothetical protein
VGKAYTVKSGPSVMGAYGKKNYAAIVNVISLIKHV